MPSQNKSWNIFKSSEDIFIPCQDICKIGKDVILVKIFLPNTNPNKIGKSKYPTSYNINTAQAQTAESTQTNENILETYIVEENSPDKQKY